MTEEQNTEEEKDNLNLLYVFFGVIISLWLLTWFLMSGMSTNDRGTFGDMFGSVNALFSGLALAGIIFTILLQKKELKLQRHELKETREEFRIQNETLRQQRFENTLFQLISIHHEIIDKLSIDDRGYRSGQFHEKREAINYALSQLENQFRWTKPKTQSVDKNGKNIEVERDPESIDEAYEYLVKAYNDFYFEDCKQVLSHYFRNIYHIFKFIYTSELIESDRRKFYASIARAQLSSTELFLILYNCLTPNLGYPNFLFLVRELEIMQNFDFNLIASNKFHKEIFENECHAVKPEFTVSNKR